MARTVTRGVVINREVYQLELTKREAAALLHLIACAETGNKLRPENNDMAIGTSIADRIIALVYPK